MRTKTEPTQEEREFWHAKVAAKLGIEPPEATDEAGTPAPEGRDAGPNFCVLRWGNGLDAPPTVLADRLTHSDAVRMVIDMLKSGALKEVPTAVADRDTGVLDVTFLSTIGLRFFYRDGRFGAESAYDKGGR